MDVWTALDQSEESSDMVKCPKLPQRQRKLHSFPFPVVLEEFVFVKRLQNLFPFSWVSAVCVPSPRPRKLAMRRISVFRRYRRTSEDDDDVFVSYSGHKVTPSCFVSC